MVTARIVLLGLLALAGATLFSPAADAPAEGKFRVYVGTYTGPKSKGIYLLELDAKSGELTPRGLAGEAVNPSFVALHPSQKFLYAVNETGNYEGKKTGAVSAFAIDPKTGNLTLLNRQPSGGADPCHLVVDKTGKAVLVANYSGGSVSSYPIQEDGKLGEAGSVIQHKGTGANPKRQEAPHAHSINLDAANRLAFAADLGLDKVLIYAFDPAKATLTAHQPASASVAGGAGPRHFAFHPSGRYAYVINEMANTVTAFAYDAKEGSLKELQTIPTLPEDYKVPGNSTAEVQVHPSGKFLYGSNRGHDSIAIYTINPESGKLTAAGHQSTQGKTPRNFGIDPTGTFLLACNQGTNNIVVFRIDPQTGALKPTGQTVEVPSPVCVKFAPLAK